MTPRAHTVPGRTTVLCVGQATLDHVFTVDGEVRSGHKHIGATHLSVGGGVAANAAVAVARLGGHAVLAGRIGDDRAGDLVVTELAAEGVDTHLLTRVPTVATPVSAVIVGPYGERTIVNHTPTELVSDDAPCFVDVEPAAVLTDGRWPAGTAAALQLARERNAGGVVDVDRRPADTDLATMLDLATHLVFGQDALAAVAGTSSRSEGLRRVGSATAALVAVTCGGEGVWWLDDGDVRWLPAPEVEPVDTAAAGDVFHGALALALAEGMVTDAALRFAAAAAALKCTRAGAREGIPARREVENFLQGADPVGGH